MRKCIGYMRVGRREQIEESRMKVVCFIRAKGKRLIDEQVEELRSFCREKNYNVVGVIKNDNNSLNTSEILDIMKKRNAEALIVRDFSIISHDVSGQIKLATLMSDLKKKVISAYNNAEINFVTSEQIRKVFEKYSLILH